MRLLLIIAVVAIAVVALVMIARASGPRVTHIEHRRETDEKDDDHA